MVDGRPAERRGIVKYGVRKAGRFVDQKLVQGVEN